jgi:hypothetical protein
MNDGAPYLGIDHLSATAKKTGSMTKLLVDILSDYGLIAGGSSGVSGVTQKGREFLFYKGLLKYGQ